MASAATYGTLDLAVPSLPKTTRSRTRATAIVAFALCAISALALIALSVTDRGQEVALTGVLGNDGGPSSRTEGSNAAYGMARNPKEEEYGFGKPGWEPGPDYYSTEKWDNAEVHPSLMHTEFDPYVGKGGCPTCGAGETKTYMFSVTPICDGGEEVRNIRKILKLDEWWRHPDFGPARYKEYQWIGSQAAYFISSHSDTIMVTPPCFFPPLANAELGVLNAAIYNLGASILILGGLQGANFLSQNLAGVDGRGYVDEGGVGRAFSHKFDIDTVFSNGPFFMQNAAATTEFFYGPRELPGVKSNTIGIPVRDLPPNTIHYYMSADEISIVFEIPAGAGRILFMGYDFSEMVPHWIDALLLARRELQIEMLYPAGQQVGLESTGLKPQAVHKPAGLKLGKSSTQLHAPPRQPSSPDLREEDHLVAAIEEKPVGPKDAVDREIEGEVGRLEAKELPRGKARRSTRPRGERRQLQADAKDMTDRGSWEHA